MNLADMFQLQQVADEEQTRRKRYKAAWEAYHGKMDAPLRKTKTDPNGEDNTIIAYSRLIVDTVVSWLFGKEPAFNLDVETERNDQEQHLDQVWEANKKMLLLQKLAINGGVCGHLFMKIVDRSPLTGNLPRLVILDPANVSVKWSDEDIDEVLRYRIQWNAIDQQTGKPVVRRQDIDRDQGGWAIRDLVSRPNDNRFETLAESRWRYSWAPVVDSQHLPVPNEYYGLSEIESLILALNKAINFGFSNNNRIQRAHGHPKTVATGVGARDIDVSPDNVIVLPNKDASIRNLEMQSDMASNFGQLDRLVDAILKLARIPPLAFGDVKNIPELSGVALAIYFQPLLQKVASLRLTYGYMLTETNRRLLDLGGHGDDLRPTNRWPELLPQNRKEQADAALILEQLGVSQETILEDLGYDPAVERQRREATGAELGEELLKSFERGQ